MDTPENTDLSIQFLFEQKKNKEKNTANDLLNKNDRQKKLWLGDQHQLPEPFLFDPN